MSFNTKGECERPDALVLHERPDALPPFIKHFLKWSSRQ